MKKNNIIIGLAGMLVLGLLVISITGAPTKATTPNAISGKATQDIVDLPDTSKGYQEITLSFENYEYILEPSTLVKDVPVRMTVDLDTVYGCMRDVVISQFNVRKYVSAGDNIIEFTPNKAGTFGIACSMNMGRGTFSVLEEDGSTSDYVETQAAAVVPAESCGGPGGAAGGAAGGCGCGSAA